MRMTGGTTDFNFKRYVFRKDPKKTLLIVWLDSEVSEWMKERIRLSRSDDTPGQG